MSRKNTTPKTEEKKENAVPEASASPVINQPEQPKAEQPPVEANDNPPPTKSETPDSDQNMGEQPKTDDPAVSEEGSDAEAVVKSGFEKIRISAICEGTPFVGSYKSLLFDEKGIAEVTAADADSLEKLRGQFPALELNHVAD